MAVIVIMRAWDPAGMEYVYWESDGYDPSGADYVGPPAFGTLIGPTALKEAQVSVPPGFSAFSAEFDETQEVAQFTEASPQFSDESDLPDVPTLEGSGIETMDNPGQPTMQHASVSYESEPRVVPTEWTSGFGISPAPLHQFEAI